MKKILAFFIAVMCMVGVAAAECGCGCGTELSGNAATVFETVKWCDAVPKNAQVVSAMEYMCKIEDHQLRLILIHVTQDENIEMMYGFAAKIIIVDSDTGEVYNYKNLSSPDSSEVVTKEDALRMVYGGYDAWLQGINEFIWADHEMRFDLTEDELTAVNAALAGHFVK